MSISLEDQAMIDVSEVSGVSRDEIELTSSFEGDLDMSQEEMESLEDMLRAQFSCIDCAKVLNYRDWTIVQDVINHIAVSDIVVF